MASRRRVWSASKIPPPPPTIAAHSNQPPPQLQQSGARETLRSAISFKPHAGELLAAAVFLRPAHTAHSRMVSPPRPSQSLLIAQVTLPFCIITFLWFFLYPVSFPRLHFVMLLIPLCFLFVNGFFWKSRPLLKRSAHLVCWRCWSG